ncbi:MAG: arylsulfatase [Verrucomicrobiales bacterium]|nr:arylsulfatase [Verrucomicrobiales bacterium]
MKPFRNPIPLPVTTALVAVCVALARPAICQVGIAQEARPNIIFILADDLGYGDLGCYGQQRIKTPQIDRMAAEGMRFTQAYAGSTVCAPSRCVLMTGFHTGHARIRGNARLPLLPKDVTVAEVLKGEGYRTALLGKWGLGEPDTTGVPNRQGFDEFFGYLNQHHAHNYYPTYLWRNEERYELANVVPNEDAQGGGKATIRRQYSHDLVADEAMRFVRSNAGTPFFLYLALTVPHANNEARDEGMEVPDLGAYADLDWPAPQRAHAAMISRMDRDIGRLFDLLKELQLDERTLVFFTSDNGPHREGGNNPGFNDSNGPLRGIKRDLYEGGIRVPFIARWPGRIQPGTVCPQLTDFADFLPTAAELSGAPVRSGIDGVSILPSLLGQTAGQQQRPYHYWEFYEQGGRRALRQGDWKAIIQPWDGNLELYDLANDIGETNNLATQRPEIASRMRRLIDEAHRPDPNWKEPGRWPVQTTP